MINRMRWEGNIYFDNNFLIFSFTYISTWHFLVNILVACKNLISYYHKFKLSYYVVCSACLQANSAQSNKEMKPKSVTYHVSCWLLDVLIKMTKVDWRNKQENFLIFDRLESSMKWKEHEPEQNKEEGDVNWKRKKYIFFWNSTPALDSHRILTELNMSATWHDARRDRFSFWMENTEKRKILPRQECLYRALNFPFFGMFNSCDFFCVSKLKTKKYEIPYETND